MLKLIYQSIVATLFLAAILCGVYPALVTGVGATLFPEQTDGGWVTLPDGRTVGSRLIGQAFTRPEYFQGRPSAAGASPGYDASNSSGSNLGPTSQVLADTVEARIQTILKENPTLRKGEIPVDWVTGSASGLDPHISPETARAQVDRVARARGISAERLQAWLNEHTEKRQWAVLGEPVVNVLLLNVKLDSEWPRIRPARYSNRDLSENVLFQ